VDLWPVEGVVDGRRRRSFGDEGSTFIVLSTRRVIANTTTPLKNHVETSKMRFTSQ
jgi:hypothetical protein